MRQPTKQSRQNREDRPLRKMTVIISRTVPSVELNDYYQKYYDDGKMAVGAPILINVNGWYYYLEDIITAEKSSIKKEHLIQFHNEIRAGAAVPQTMIRFIRER